MNLESYGGRRFLLTVVSGAGTFLLVLFGKITGDVYATVTIATVAAYITGNTVQKVMPQQGEAPAPPKQK